MLIEARAAHQLVRACDQRAERTAEALRETERHRVEQPGDLGGRRARGNGGVHQARTVEMRAQPELPGRRDDLAQLVERPDGPARRVVRVLEGDDRGMGRPVVVLVTTVHRLPQLRGAEAAAIPGKAAGLQAGVHRSATELADHDVRALLEDQLGATLAEDRKRDLVTHRRRGQIDSLLVTEEQRRATLQLEDGWVLALLLVADLGVRHRVAHRAGRLRHRVGAEVDRHACDPTRVEACPATPEDAA
jgi:hypothetical protein